MGEFAEWELERQLDRMMIEERPRRYRQPDRHGFLFDDQTWTTKDGETLKIEDMTPSHRANTLAMLRRKYGAFIDTTPLGKRLARED